MAGTKEKIIARGSARKIKWELYIYIREAPLSEKETKASKEFVNFRVFREYTWNDKTKKYFNFAIWESEDVATAIAAAKEAYESSKNIPEISAIEDIL